MIEIHKNFKSYIKNNYSIQKFDKSYYTDDGDLVAEPSDYLSNLLEINPNDVIDYTNTGNSNKIITFNLIQTKKSHYDFYIEGFFKKLFSDKSIFDGVHSGTLKIILLCKNTLYDFKDSHPNTNKKSQGIIKELISLEDIFHFATELFGLSNTSLIFLSDNLFMNMSQYNANVKSKLHGTVSHILDEYSYVKENYKSRTSIEKYISNINNLNDIRINIKNIDTPYNFILFKYLVESGNLNKVYLNNVRLDLYDYPLIKSIFDKGLKYCKVLKYTHLEKYLTITVDDYESLIQLSKQTTDYSNDTDVYDKTLFTIIYNIIDSNTNLKLPIDVLDAITHHHPLVLIGPKNIITAYSRMGYRKSFFMYRDTLLDAQESDKSIPHFLRDLDILFNTNFLDLKNTILKNKDILEYNNDFLYNLNSTHYILTKIASKLIDKNLSISELLKKVYLPETREII